MTCLSLYKPFQCPQWVRLRKLRASLSLPHRHVSFSCSSSNSSSCYRTRERFLKLYASSKSSRYVRLEGSLQCSLWGVHLCLTSLIAKTNHMQSPPVKFRTLVYHVSIFSWASLLWTAPLQLARMVSALQQQQQQQQQQQRQPSMKHSPSHPVGPKPHLDNMVPNTLNVGLPDLQTKGPIPGYGSGKLLVMKTTFFQPMLGVAATLPSVLTASIQSR